MADAQGYYCEGCKGQTSIIIDDQIGQVTCVTCGTVLEHSMVRHEVDFTPGGGGPMGQYINKGADGNVSTQLKTAHNRIQKIQNDMRFSGALGTEAKAIARQLLDNECWTNISEVVAGAVVFIAARRHSDQPVTLADVAAQAETTVFALGRAVKEIEQLLGSKVAHVNAKHLIKRACQGMTERPGKDGMAAQAKGSLIMWPKEVMADLEKVAGELYDLLDACLLQVGRKPVTVAGACLVVATKVYGLKECTADRIAKALDLPGTHSVMERVTELRDLLLRIGQSLPWGRSVDSKTVYLYTKAILGVAPQLVQVVAEKEYREWHELRGLAVPHSKTESAGAQAAAAQAAAAAAVAAADNTLKALIEDPGSGSFGLPSSYIRSRLREQRQRIVIDKMESGEAAPGSLLHKSSDKNGGGQLGDGDGDDNDGTEAVQLHDLLDAGNAQKRARIEVEAHRSLSSIDRAKIVRLLRAGADRELIIKGEYSEAETRLLLARFTDQDWERMQSETLTEADCADEEILRLYKRSDAEVRVIKEGKKRKYLHNLD